jgi:polysaccharide pyruvyl transferase CsaB
VLAGLLAGLRQLRPDLRPIVLSGNPSSTHTIHHVDAQSRGPLSLWRALASAGLFVSGGGSLVQDVTSARSALYYLGAMIAAATRGVPVAVVGTGVGPIRRSWVRRLAAYAFSRAGAISVRDGESAKLLEGLGLAIPIHQGADLAFLAPGPDSSRVDALLTRHGLHRTSGRIGIALRPWPRLRNPDELGRGIRRVADTYKADVAVFTLDRARDREVSAIAAEASGGALVDVESPQDLIGALGAMDVVVGVRLHALICAVGQGVPCVGLTYDPKVSAFMTEFGLPGVLPIDATGLAVAEALARTWEGRSVLHSRLAAALPDARARALAGLDWALRLLGRPSAAPHGRS